MILSLFLLSLNVSNYHIADSIMRKFLILNQCHNRKYLYYLSDDMEPVYVNSCMIQQNVLTCPFSFGHCSCCYFNPLFWQDRLSIVPKDYIEEFESKFIKVAHNFER